MSRARREVTGHSRRAFLSAGLAIGSVALLGCFPDDDAVDAAPTTTPFDPTRTVDSDEPASDVVSLSGSDLDCLSALGVNPVAAWAHEGVDPRPWRPGAPPPEVSWEGEGLPSAAALLRTGAGALVMTGADPSVAQLRAFENVAAVVAARPEPGWRTQVRQVAAAVGARDFELTERTARALEDWSRAVRGRDTGAFAITLPGEVPDPDEPVATLASDSPFAKELDALGFPVISHSDPVPPDRLAADGVDVLTVAADDADLRVALAQPSVLSLPWALERLAAS